MAKLKRELKEAIHCYNLRRFSLCLCFVGIALNSAFYTRTPSFIWIFYTIVLLFWILLVGLKDVFRYRKRIRELKNRIK
jgi:hypothetical protein